MLVLFLSLNFQSTTNNGANQKLDDDDDDDNDVDSDRDNHHHSHRSS